MQPSGTLLSFCPMVTHSGIAKGGEGVCVSKIVPGSVADGSGAAGMIKGDPVGQESMATAKSIVWPVLKVKMASR